MSNDKNIPPTPPCDLVVKRNEVELPLVNYRILRGPKENSFYPAPQVTPETLPTFLGWLGQPTLIAILQSEVKKKFQNIFSQATSEETGVADINLFLKYAAEFTSQGMKVKEIRDRIEELGAKLSGIIQARKWVGTSPEALEVQKQLADLDGEINAYRQMLEDKQRKPKTDDEVDEPSVEA